MTDTLKSWFSVAHVLWMLVFAFVSMIAYIVNWKSDLESRVHILEVRGSPHLAEINNRLTVTEKETQANTDRMDGSIRRIDARIDEIVRVMTRDLHMNVPTQKP